MNATRIFLAAALVFCSSADAHGEPLRLDRVSDDVTVLFANGQAKLSIIIAADAGETTHAAAAELRAYLQQMSGVAFDVRTDAGGPGIFVGTQQQFSLPQFKSALTIGNGHEGAEAFVIYPDGESLYLVGASEKGVSHAVFRFLQRLGCRWYFPAREWEVIPPREEILADFVIADRPAIAARRIWWGYAFFDRAEGRCQKDYEAWARHNLMGESFRTYTGHAWQAIIAENQAIFDKHPEYLALVDGQRRGPQFCVSQPAVRKLAAEWALKRLKMKPELDMVSMETADGSFHCQCAECEKLGSISERAFGLANEVARVVAEKYPGRMVGMLAYNDHCEPPSFPLEPNVYVQSTAGFVRGRYTFDELMELWPKKTRNIGFYEYFSVWLWDFDQLPGGRANDIEEITRRIRRYVQLGATSLSCESGNNWGVHGRGYYIANKLMWNPDQDVDALLDDFYRTAFGPAATAMRRFYERFDVGSRPLMSEHLLARGFRDLQLASELAANRPDVRARLDHLKQYMHYVRLRWELDHLPKSEEKQRKALTLQGLTWCYRSRYSYMNHWAAMWLSWTRQAADEFAEPTWSFKHDGDHPWSSKEPLTKTETERVFQTDLQRFQPQDITETEFSQQLVWDDLKNLYPKQVRPQALLHRFQRPMRYAVISKDGEPIRFAITSGVIQHYRDRADGRWTVSESDGNPLATGKITQDGEIHPIEVKVTRAGLHWIDYNDQGAGWGIQTAEDVPISLALQRGQRILHLGQFRQPIFFFVPRGTKRLQFFWEGGNLNPQVHGPDGTLLAEVKTSGKYVSVDVPGGADGKAWFFTRFAPKRIWFANAPNFLAASPETLVLPQEALSKLE